jgi:hypothetical protein
LDTKAITILPDWPKFKAITKELKFINELREGEKVFMRNTLVGTYEPLDLTTFAWAINYLLIDANKHVLSPIMDTSVSTLKHNIVTAHLETNGAIKAVNK